MSKHIIGMDLGNGFVKAVAKEAMRQFPTQHGFYELPNLPSSLWGSSNERVVEKRDNGWVVYGYDAEQALDPRFIRRINGAADVDNIDQLRNYVLATLSSIFNPGVYNITMIYGLPVKNFNEEYTKRNIAYGFKPSGEPTPFYTANNMGEYTFIFDRISFIAQPTGTLWDMLLDKNGKVSVNRDFDPANENVMVVDIGSGTVDVNMVQRLTPNPGLSFSFDAGINYILDDLRKEMVEVYGLQLQTPTLRECLQTLTYHNNNTNETLQLDGLISEIASTWWTSIAQGVHARISDLSAVNRIFLTGGGAGLFYDFAVEHYGSHRVFMPTQPVTANASGFYKYGVHAHGKES